MNAPETAYVVLGIMTYIVVKLSVLFKQEFHSNKENMVRIIIDNYIRVTGLPRDVFHAVRTRLTYPNPQYEAALKFQKRGMLRYLPKTVHSYEYEDNEMLLPRGIFMQFMDYIGRLGLPFDLIDRRQKGKVRVPDRILTLRSYQEKLISEGNLYPGLGYILQSPPGTGKCCNINTLIKTNGGWSRIQDLPQQIKIPTFTGQRKVSHLHPMGVSRTKIIEANTVYSIECTPYDHYTAAEKVRRAGLPEDLATRLITGK